MDMTIYQGRQNGAPRQIDDRLPVAAGLTLVFFDCSDAAALEAQQATSLGRAALAVEHPADAKKTSRHHRPALKMLFAMA